MNNILVKITDTIGMIQPKFDPSERGALVKMDHLLFFVYSRQSMSMSADLCKKRGLPLKCWNKEYMDTPRYRNPIQKEISALRNEGRAKLLLDSSYSYNRVNSVFRGTAGPPDLSVAQEIGVVGEFKNDIKNL